jgi:four helix bundle protein
LAVNIYKIFGQIRDYGFRDQICRAAVSISNNIAEGFDRNSDADFCRFLYIAISSSSETKSMLYLAEKLNYISKAEMTRLINDNNEVAKIIRGLIKSISNLKS